MGEAGDEAVDRSADSHVRESLGKSRGQSCPRSERQPDVLHAHWVYPDAYAALRWAKPRGMKTVITVHGHAGFGWFGPKSQRRHYREALANADHVIAVSSEIKSKLVNEFGLDAGRVTVIHNGVDLEKFPPLPKNDARRNLGLPVNKRVLLTVARLSPEKQLGLLIAAAHRCLKRHDLQLVLVGEGPEEAALRAQIAELGVENRILLEGGIAHDRLRDWYYAADLFCLASHNEGCPVVVHEALACGLPVVSTAVGAVPDLVHRDDYGLLCRNGNVDELGAQIDRALDKTWDCERIAAYGRQHTWDAVVDQTLGVYDAVVRQMRCNL